MCNTHHDLNSRVTLFKEAKLTGVYENLNVHKEYAMRINAALGLVR